MPPANGADILTILPSETLHQIVMATDLFARHSLKLSCKALRPFGDNLPPMSQGEYVEFQRRLETHSSHKLKNLYCPSCDTFKRPTPSNTIFTDAQAVQRLRGRRICVECGIANGYYNRRDVVIKKKKLFLCGGCKLLLPPEKEETAVTNVVFTKAFPWHDEGWGSGAEITIGSGRKRWCKPCRAAIANLGDSGAVKVKKVHVP